MTRAWVVAVLLVVFGCTAPAVTPQNRPTLTRPALIVVPTSLGSGRVEVRVAHAYTLGVAANIPISVRTTRGMITGPLAARVVATRQPRP